MSEIPCFIVFFFFFRGPPPKFRSEISPPQFRGHGLQGLTKLSLETQDREIQDFDLGMKISN